MIKRIFLTGFFSLGAVLLFAQQTYKYRAALPKVDSGGFYKINLQPSLTAKCNTDLSDVRLLNGAGKFTPYIFGSNLPYNEAENFVIFPQVSNPEQTDSTTIFIAENRNTSSINQLWLRLRNTSVQRTVNLSGSDDLEHWYAIRENISLEEAGANGEGIYQQLLNFPSSTYRYFKIQINNKHNEPVALLQAGIYRQQTDDPDYIGVKHAGFTQEDSGKVSYIRIRFPEKYFINKLHLDFAGSKYYRRDVRIYSIEGQGRTLLDEGQLISTRPRDLYFTAKTNSLELEIVNGDNPPLTVISLTASQLSQSVISYLEKGEQYYVLAGDANAIMPEYDLNFFADSLQRQLPQLNHIMVTANPLYKTKNASGSHLPGWVIWVAIVAALLILVILTVKMTKEVKKRAAENQ